MDEAKKMGLNILHYHVSKQVLEKFLKQGSLTKEEFKKADSYLYERYEIDKSFGYDWHKEDGRVKNAHNQSQADICSNDEYLSLTDIARQHDVDKPGYAIQSWLRNRNTLEFLNLWEQENNPSYNTKGYDDLKAKSLDSAFTVSPKQWIELTGAIGIKSRQGKNGGTYAHITIACEFLTWLSPRFKLYLIEMCQLPKTLVGNDGIKSTG